MKSKIKVLKNRPGKKRSFENGRTATTSHHLPTYQKILAKEEADDIICLGVVASTTAKNPSVTTKTNETVCFPPPSSMQQEEHRLQHFQHNQQQQQQQQKFRPLQSDYLQSLAQSQAKFKTVPVLQLQRPEASSFELQSSSHSVAPLQQHFVGEMQQLRQQSRVLPSLASKSTPNLSSARHSAGTPRPSSMPPRELSNPPQPSQQQQPVYNVNFDGTSGKNVVLVIQQAKDGLSINL